MSKKQLSPLTTFLRWSDKTAGKSTSFIIALAFLLLWIIVGFIFGFTDIWLLILTAVATVNASLMVFIIQNTQNRQMKALNIKLDGILAAIKETENELIAIEEIEEIEIDRMRHELLKKSFKKDSKNQNEENKIKLGKRKSLLSRFLTWSSRTAGNPLAFVIALLILVLWTVLGLFWGFHTDLRVTWLLVIDLIATVNASLMVFIIQNTQNRETKAIHLKLDGLIDAIKETERELIAIEEAEEEELEMLRQTLIKKNT